MLLTPGSITQTKRNISHLRTRYKIFKRSTTWFVPQKWIRTSTHNYIAAHPFVRFLIYIEIYRLQFFFVCAFINSIRYYELFDYVISRQCQNYERNVTRQGIRIDWKCHNCFYSRISLSDEMSTSRSRSFAEEERVKLHVTFTNVLDWKQVLSELP